MEVSGFTSESAISIFVCETFCTFRFVVPRSPMRNPASFRPISNSSLISSSSSFVVLVVFVVVFSKSSSPPNKTGICAPSSRGGGDLVRRFGSSCSIIISSIFVSFFIYVEKESMETKKRGDQRLKKK